MVNVVFFVGYKLLSLKVKVIILSVIVGIFEIYFYCEICDL